MNDEVDFKHAIVEPAYEAYTTYLALKNHFTEDHYDYFDANGKVTTTVDAFSRRRDKGTFLKLSQKLDYHHRILAHILKDPESVWVRTILEDDGPYYDWLKRFNTLTRQFTNELSQFQNLKQAITVVDGTYPILLSEHYAGNVSLETLTMLDIATGVMDYWNGRIQDTMLFPTLYKKVRKYKPFLPVNKRKLAEIIQSL